MQVKNYDPQIPIVIANLCPDAQAIISPVLDQWFGREHYALSINDATDCNEFIRALTDDSGQWIKGLRCVSGVFDQRLSIGVPDCLPANYQMVTFVGDPMRLAVAEYHRQKKQPNFWHKGQPAEFSQCFPTLESFVRRYPDWLYARLPQDVTLANLSQKMGQEFLFVAVLESLQESVNQLAELIDKPSVELSATWESGEQTFVSESLRQQFYAHYPRPKAIWDFAVSITSGSRKPNSRHRFSDSATTGLRGPHRVKINIGELNLEGPSLAD